MNIDFDPYVILGVSPEASFDEIKDAHRRAVRRLHSDTNPNKGAVVQLQDINVRNDELVRYLDALVIQLGAVIANLEEDLQRRKTA